MSDTKERILDTMQALIQSRGYSAVSYQDIAIDLDLRKASIHHHFATKAKLGVAVIERYSQTFAGILAKAEAGSANPNTLLKLYLQPFRDFGATGDKICLGGALGGEFLALPKSMQTSVTDFFDQQQKWLETLLRSGKRAEVFAFSGSARTQARLIFSALQGALLIKRSNGDDRQLEDVITEIKMRLRPT